MDSAHASIPSNQTCMNCHSLIKNESPLLAPIVQGWMKSQQGEADEPVPWIKVHMLPDYAYFDHSAHVGVSPDAGIGCGRQRAQVRDQGLQGLAADRRWRHPAFRDPGRLKNIYVNCVKDSAFRPISLKQ